MLPRKEKVWDLPIHDSIVIQFIAESTNLACCNYLGTLHKQYCREKDSTEGCFESGSLDSRCNVLTARRCSRSTISSDIQQITGSS